MLVDLGYRGLDKKHQRVTLPVRKSKKKPLTKLDRAHNRALARQRVVVEHIIRCCKVFRICKAEYRGKHRNVGRTWNLVAMLVNLKRQFLLDSKT